MRIREMIKNSLFSCCIAVLLMMSCRHKIPAVSIVDEEMTIHAMTRSEPDSAGVYNVRILPKKELLEQNSTIGRNMMYGADSCFYIMEGVHKIYPIGTECIANGVANSFEYLVRFDSKVSAELFYQDKYINKKNYHLVFK